MRRWIVLAVWLSCACTPSAPEGRFACETDGECPEGMTCRTSRGRCFFTEDAASPE